MPRLDAFIADAPDPDAAARRVERMREDAQLRAALDGLDEAALARLVALISLSDFLFHFLCRHPGEIGGLGAAGGAGREADAQCNSAADLRLYKYRRLLRITWMEWGPPPDYTDILYRLSDLADEVLARALHLAIEPAARPTFRDSLCVLGLGKLGARELNYSSDVDLVFISANRDQSGARIEEFQKRLMDGLRRFTRLLEESTAEGFLYRVDLNLRPWGRSGPLFMAIDDAEHYYEASSDPWERFAWLRARPVAGAGALGADMLERLRPFVFARSLSTQHLERLVEIKSEMSRVRKRRGHWDVKAGEGGIRDLEFFVQTLQMVNGGRHPALRRTNTIETLGALLDGGFISAQEEQEIRGSYLFLRRLENRLQMVREQQTHELPDDPARRIVLARSLGVRGESRDQVLHNFETDLFVHRSIARGYFERILPGAEP